MATFHFDLVSPEKLLFSGEVDQVDVPGAEGDFGVLAERISAQQEKIKGMEGSLLDREIQRLDQYQQIEQHLHGTGSH